MAWVCKKCVSLHKSLLNTFGIHVGDSENQEPVEQEKVPWKWKSTIKITNEH